MAEFCLDCFNIVNETELKDGEVIVEFDYCERCNKNLPCVIGILPNNDENE